MRSSSSAWEKTKKQGGSWNYFQQSGSREIPTPGTCQMWWNHSSSKGDIFKENENTKSYLYFYFHFGELSPRYLR